MSKQRCQTETTSTEFLDWMIYLEQDVNAFHREDFFLANIAKSIIQANSKDPKSVKLKHFLLKFEQEDSKASKASKMKQSLLAWAGIKKV